MNAALNRGTSKANIVIRIMYKIETIFAGNENFLAFMELLMFRGF